MKRRTWTTAAVLAVLAALATLLPGGPALAQDADQTPAPPPGARVTDQGWFRPRVAPNRPELPDQVDVAVVIPIRGGIEGSTYDIIVRKVAQARNDGAKIIIFEMNTPGGLSDTMGKITDLIMDDLRDIYTVAYVNRRAISAGAIISLACDEIVMHPAGTIGDAMPILIGPQGVVELPEAVRTKIEDYARATVRVIAEKNGYNLPLCQAMISIPREVWEVRNVETNELRYVDAEQWRHKVVGSPKDDDMIAAALKALQQRAAPATGEKTWEYVRTADGPNELLTMTARETVALGFTEHLFEDIEGLKKHYNITTLIRLEHTIAHKVAEFMNSMAVSGLLIMATLVLAYMEIRTPGFGIAGTLALVCLGLLIGSRYVLDLANELEIVIVVVGFILLAVEVFITPGFGVLGITGIVLMVAGLLAMGVRGAPMDIPLPRTAPDWETFRNGALALAFGFLGSLVVGGLISKYLPKARFASALILDEVPETHDAPVPQSSPMRAIQVGHTGIVESMCRPVGKVRFGDDLLDAMSEGAQIEVGATVRVLRHDGNRLIVEKIG